MKASNEPSKKSSIPGLGLSDARSFLEDVGTHILLEVSLVGIVDRYLNNTFLSMLVGICIVEGVQFLLKKWRVKY